MTAGRLSPRTKLAYGVTDLGFSMSYTIITFYLLFFLTDVAGLKPRLAGLVFLVGKIWDAVIDPSIGHYSDHLRTRWGRRRPIFLFGAAPFGLTFLLLWNLPRLHNQMWLALAVGAAYMLHIFVSSLLSVPYTALAPELTEDYDERTSLTAYRMVFSIVGGLVAVIIPGVFADVLGSVRLGYGVMGIAVGAFLVVCPLAAFFGTREPRHQPAERDEAPVWVRLWRDTSQCFKNRPFVFAMIMFLATWVAIDVISSIFIYYVKYWLNMEPQSSILMGAIFGMAALCLPLWVKVSDAIGKKAAYITGMGFLSIILLFLMFVQPGHPALVYTLAVLAGIGVSAAHVLSHAIMPDVIEYDELQTGQRREGVYYGIITFLQQLASSGAIFLVAQLLSAGGYVANAAQTPRALWTIRLLIGLGPGLLFAVGVAALLFYPINKKLYSSIRQQLDARRAIGP